MRLGTYFKKFYSITLTFLTILLLNLIIISKKVTNLLTILTHSRKTSHFSYFLFWNMTVQTAIFDLEFFLNNFFTVYTIQLYWKITKRWYHLINHLISIYISLYHLVVGTISHYQSLPISRIQEQFQLVSFDISRFNILAN